MKHVLPRLPRPVARFRLVRTVIVGTVCEVAGGSLNRFAVCWTSSNGTMAVSAGSRGGGMSFVFSVTGQMDSEASWLFMVGN